MSKFKEMVYQEKHLKRPEVLLDEEVGEFRVRIHTLGVCPTAYIGIPKRYKWAWGLTYHNFNAIGVHGGVNLCRAGDGEIFPEGYYWVGWTYDHAGDRYGAGELMIEGKEWTTEEIYQEAVDAAYKLHGTLELTAQILDTFDLCGELFTKKILKSLAELGERSGLWD